LCHTKLCHCTINLGNQIPIQNFLINNLPLRAFNRKNMFLTIILLYSITRHVIISTISSLLEVIYSLLPLEILYHKLLLNFSWCIFFPIQSISLTQLLVQVSSLLWQNLKLFSCTSLNVLSFSLTTMERHIVIIN